MTRDDIHAKFRAAERCSASTSSTPRRSTWNSSRASARWRARPGATRPATSRAGKALLPDHRHSPRTFDDLLNKTPWEKYGHGKDPRCEHCMVHSGFEASAALGVNGKLGDTLQDDQVATELTART